MQRNIKLGRGGIREIEFFGQMFQLIRGGVSPSSRKGRSAKYSLNWPPRATSRRGSPELEAAYVFLRTVEHRLQEAADQQTHDLHRIRRPGPPGGLPGV